MLDVLLDLISQAVLLDCHGCLVVCRCLQLTSCDRSVQSALAMITPAECGKLLRSPSSSSGLMAWLWTAASISQVTQHHMTTRTGAGSYDVCSCCDVASSCLSACTCLHGLSVCQVCVADSCITPFLGLGQVSCLITHFIRDSEFRVSLLVL